PPLPARKRIENIDFEFDLDMYRGTAPMYFGSYALPIVETMKRTLRPGDTFLDVGANIGYLSAIAAGLVGMSGQVHSFEPVPEYFRRVERLASLNPQYTIRAKACALGEVPGNCTIYVTREPGQSTLVSEYKAEPEVVATLEVPVIRLDSYLKENGIERVQLIKIDAEGFELPILKGLDGFFRSSRCRPDIICEIAPRAYPLMGRRISELAEYMAGYGYEARDLLDGATPIQLTEIRQVIDVLFSVRENRR
ncbi:MAG TPA: FkbM family methyltransferase, partial [Candidatus Acidoferrales bacterium]